MLHLIRAHLGGGNPEFTVLAVFWVVGENVDLIVITTFTTAVTNADIAEDMVLGESFGQRAESSDILIGLLKQYVNTLHPSME